MPKGYEEMRDKFKREGLSASAAKGKAARIWNSQHPNNPVTGHSERKRPKKDSRGYY
jgi:hypothetical protein